MAPTSGEVALVAKQFVEFYYTAFDSNRPSLAGLYRDQSMLTFESHDSSWIQGGAQIVEKLINLPFQKVVHVVDSLDSQPTHDGSGIVVLVTGKLKTDDEANPMSFTQSFVLLPDGQGSFFVFNDIFRLVYPAA